MKKNENLLLTLILIFALVLRLIFFTGIDSSDSLGYAKAAYAISKGLPPSEENQGVGTLRLGILFPVAIMYSIFGVNEFSSNILVLIISLGFIILTYKLGRLLFDAKTGLISAFLLSFFPFDVINSTRLNTDITSAFFVTLAIYFFMKSEILKDRKHLRIQYLFSGIFLGIAYLIKELSLLIGLFFLAYVIYNKKIKSDYFFIALGFILLFSIELLYFLKLTGNPFYRYSYVSSEYASKIIIENRMQGRSAFLTGLFHYPYIMLTDKLLGVFYPFIFIAIAYSMVNRKKETHVLLLWFVPILLYLIFGSLSITKYIPIPATSRFLSIVTIPGILLLSYFLLQNQPLIKRILKPSILALLLATSLGYIYISEDRFSLDDERFAYNYLKLLPKKQIYADERTVAIFDYLSGYKDNNNIKSFHRYDQLKSENSYALELNKIRDSYVVINRKIINFYLVSKENIKFPNEIFDLPNNWVLKKELGKGKDNIQIYYIPEK